MYQVHSFLYSIVWIHHNLFIHFLVDGHLNCFQFLAIMSKAAMKIFTCPFFRHIFPSLLGKYLGIQSLGHKVGIAKQFSREILPFYTPNHIVSIPSHLHQLLLAGQNDNLIVALICISLMNNDAEQFFTCLLTIHISSFVKFLFRYFTHFNWVDCLLNIDLWEFFIFTELKCFIWYMCCKYCCSAYGLPFIFLYGIF